jgi:hypothetical protein
MLLLAVAIALVGSLLGFLHRQRSGSDHRAAAHCRLCRRLPAFQPPNGASRTHAGQLV